MLKITKEEDGREGWEGREGREGGEGTKNQRELSTAGRWQTDTHFKNTHTHTLDNTTHKKSFKHLNASVCRWRLCPYTDLLSLAGRDL